MQVVGMILVVKSLIDKIFLDTLEKMDSLVKTIEIIDPNNIKKFKLNIENVSNYYEAFNSMMKLLIECSKYGSGTITSLRSGIVDNIITMYNMENNGAKLSVDYTTFGMLN